MRSATAVHNGNGRRSYTSPTATSARSRGARLSRTAFRSAAGPPIGRPVDFVRRPAGPTARRATVQLRTTAVARFHAFLVRERLRPDLELGHVVDAFRPVRAVGIARRMDRG